MADLGPVVSRYSYRPWFGGWLLTAFVCFVACCYCSAFGLQKDRAIVLDAIVKLPASAANATALVIAFVLGLVAVFAIYVCCVAVFGEKELLLHAAGMTIPDARARVRRSYVISRSSITAYRELYRRYGKSIRVVWVQANDVWYPIYALCLPGDEAYSQVVDYIATWASENNAAEST